MLQLNFTPFPVLTTERLLLRQLNDDDDSQIFALRSDEAVNKYLDRLKARSIDEAQKFIKKINSSIDKNESLYWGICLKNNDRIIGTACIWNIDKEVECAEIGYELLPAFQGKGLMMEAIKAIIDFAFGEIGLKKILAFAKAENDRSANLLKKIGFVTDKEEGKKLSDEESAGNVIYCLIAK